jgi:hypothetical protein
MPLEISEIGIRLAVGEPAASHIPAAAEPGTPMVQLTPQEIDQLVRRCVEDVLATLRLMEAR